MLEIKNSELKIKNDEMRGKAGPSSDEAASTFCKMTFLPVMAGSWHKKRNRRYPVMDCIPLIQLYFPRPDKKMAQGLLILKGFSVFLRKNRGKTGTLRFRSDET